MSSLNRHIGKSIALTRKSRSMSQQTLADHLGVTRVYVGMIERGDRNVSIKMLNKISQVLDVVIDVTFTPK